MKASTITRPGRKPVLGNDGVALRDIVLQHGVVAEAQDQAQAHSGVPGDPLQLLLAFLAAHPLPAAPEREWQW